ncbi:Hypothetical predicted protein, partial [Marmota monax]
NHRRCDHPRRNQSPWAPGSLRPLEPGPGFEPTRGSPAAQQKHLSPSAELQAALLPRSSLGCYLSTAQDHRPAPPPHWTPGFWKQSDSILNHLPRHFMGDIAHRWNCHLSRYLISSHPPAVIMVTVASQYKISSQVDRSAVRRPPGVSWG